MLYFLIGGIDRTSDVQRGSFSKTDALQQRVDTANFILIDGARPSQNQEIKIFDGTTIVSQSLTTVIISQNFSEFSKFRVGDKLWIGIGEASEEMVEIASINKTTITLAANPLNSHSVGEKIGRKIFGGTIQSVSDENIFISANLLIKVSCADYSKIFDKKLVNDSWKDRSSKYIIVDFLNTFVNYNHQIDGFEYANATAIRAAWTESSDGDNPNIDTSDFQEGDTAGVFPWTNSGGTATFSAAPTAANIRDLVGVASGAPSSGILAFWYKQSDNTAVSSVSIRIGSDSSNYTELTLTPEANNNWNYARLNLAEGTTTGTPNWNALDYVAIIVSETASANIKLDGLRINADGSFTFDNVETGIDIPDFRSSFKNPSTVIQQLADQNKYYWFIDYERDIHFFPSETNSAPISLDENSDNYFDLQIAMDATKIVNRQVVRGANETSSQKVQQDIPGDGIKREWVLRNKFRNLVVMISTAGGAFATSSVGIEYIDNETSAAYFSNYNAQSVRAAASTSTLMTTSVIRFRYHEIIPIVVQSKDNASITALKAILGNDGVFDGRVIVDNNLKSRNEADATAQIEISKYSNPIITATFTTNFEGLRSGQIIYIKDSTTGRNIDQNFIIQSVKTTPQSEDQGINEYNVTCASTVFGIIELLQKILRDSTNSKIDENEVIYNVESLEEEIRSTDSWTQESQNIVNETVSVTESLTSDIITPPFQYGPGGSPQGRYNLSSWG